MEALTARAERRWWVPGRATVAASLRVTLSFAASPRALVMYGLVVLFATYGSVVSDVSHNLTGHAATDSVQQCDLVAAALSFASSTLLPGGAFVAKVRARACRLACCNVHCIRVPPSSPHLI